MNQINDLPRDTSYGEDFNYLMWTAGTTATFCNVPWNSDYRDIVRFPNQAGLNNYIRDLSGPTIEITKLSYAKFGRPIRIDRPFNAVQKFNYLKVSNPLQPIPGDVAKSFYYFIVGVEYINPNCTEIYVQLDVWQTFGYEISFGNAYIEQGHIGIANEKSFDHYGRDYLTVPEGFDIGNEYNISKVYSERIASARVKDSNGKPDYDILVASNISLTDDYGTVEAPKLVSGKGSTMEQLPNGCEFYAFDSLTDFKTFIEYLADFPWIAQGIVSITAIPARERYLMTYGVYDIAPGIVIKKISDYPLIPKRTNMKENWRNDIDLGRYASLKKFKVFPYCIVEMTTNVGTPLVLKPECWGDANMTIVENAHLAPPSPRISIYPLRYNSVGDNNSEVIDEYGQFRDGGEFMDMATGILNFPSFSIVNDGYMQFMANNASGIAYQHSSADWSQNKALRGNSVSYDQASAGIELSKNLTGQGINAATQSTALANQTSGFRAMQSGINSLGGIGRGPGGVIGAATGVANSAAGYAIDSNQNNQSLAISSGLASGQNQATASNAGYIRDTNRSLSDWAANGDYQNQIAGINAKVQDAKMTQPTTAGQVGGDAFNLATYQWSVDMKVKVLQPGVMAAIGEMWLRYGYAVQRYGKMPASFMVMEKFTYWRLKETYITSSQCPETFKQAIRGIFEKGVTVWKNPADIGTIDIADNAPLSGVTL